MKKITNQVCDNFSNQTCILLSSLNEANEIIRSSSLYTSNKPDSADFHFVDSIRSANVWLNKQSNKLDYRSALEQCFKEQEVGDPSIIEAINEKTALLHDLTLNIDPSLRNEDIWTGGEEGLLCDPGELAAGGDKPMLKKTATHADIKPGSGDGAYRILINTDVSWWGDPTTQCATLCALALIVQQRGPLEIWIQQGWMGIDPCNGITLFPIHKGGLVTPQLLYFWIGSNKKDSPYSCTLNSMLGRTNSFTSTSADIPCDLYIYGQWMPEIDIKNNDQIALWLSTTSRKMLFNEEEPDERFGR